MVDEWGLSDWKAPILDRWNDINLYTMTRGINRFKGLAMALREIHEQYCPIEEIEVLEKYIVENLGGVIDERYAEVDNRITFTNGYANAVAEELMAA
jgi:hypothetical protein